MGNSSSKPKDSLKTPAFTRSDTANSAKSSRSIRSRISLSKNDSDVSSFKTATDSPKLTPQSPLISRKNSSNTVSGNGPGSQLNSRRNSSNNLNQLNIDSSHSHSNNNNNHSSNNNDTVNYSDNNIPILSNSMSNSAIEPDPILIRRNTDEVITPISSSFNKGALNGTPRNSPSINAVDIDLSSGSNIPSSHSNSYQGHSRSNSHSNIYSSGRSGKSNQANTGIIDVEDLIQRLLDAGYSGKRTKNVCLKNSEIGIVCARAREILLSQPPLLELSPPVKIVGDVHGQYGDLIRTFSKCGFPPSTNYLFLGDYVDRGKQSLETILLLLCYKIKYPENFFLLRGNHECANVTRVYGFYDECKRRCNIKTWKLFIDTFNTLPIAAIVAGKIFCVHGGLSPVLNSMDEIRTIARPTDVPDFGLLNDLLWSDPADTQNEWEDNERGVSYVFSKVAINKFLAKFGFDLVCRAHMVVEDGYEFFNDRTLVTVFSAPNYCGEFDNWGAVMSVSEELLCSFELLDPLDSVALKQEMKKGKHERRYASITNSNPINQSF